MTPKCKHCGNDIDETHVTEEIDREGETVARHYCSAHCLARDKGYAQSLTQPITDPFPNPQPIPDPPNPNPGPNPDDPLDSGPYWQQWPYDVSSIIDNSIMSKESDEYVRVPTPRRYE